jgi:hypothetical protein
MLERAERENLLLFFDPILRPLADSILAALEDARRLRLDETEAYRHICDLFGSVFAEESFGRQAALTRVEAALKCRQFAQRVLGLRMMVEAGQAIEMSLRVGGVWPLPDWWDRGLELLRESDAPPARKFYRVHPPCRKSSGIGLAHREGRFSSVV